MKESIRTIAAKRRIAELGSCSRWASIESLEPNLAKVTQQRFRVTCAKCGAKTIVGYPSITKSKQHTGGCRLCCTTKKEKP